MVDFRSLAASGCTATALPATSNHAGHRSVSGSSSTAPTGETGSTTRSRRVRSTPLKFTKDPAWSRRNFRRRFLPRAVA
jgi:hypothetical protein